MSEQIRRILTVSEIDKKTAIYDHKKFCGFVDTMRERFRNFFDETKPLDYNKPANSLRYKNKDDISPAIIRKRLDNISHRLSGIDYLHVFSLYDIYSKYDHFGVMSMFLENMEINEICDNMLWSIFHITDGIGFCIDLLKDEVNCKSNFEKIDNKICYLRGITSSKTLWLSPEYKASLL